MRHKLRLSCVDAKLTEPVEIYVAVDNALNAMPFGERLPVGLAFAEGSRNTLTILRPETILAVRRVPERYG